MAVHPRSDEKVARLNLVRYGLFLTVVLAMTITPTALFLAAGPAGEPSRIVMPTVIATLLTAAVAAAVYVAYSRWLDGTA